MEGSEENRLPESVSSRSGSAETGAGTTEDKAGNVAELSSSQSTVPDVEPVGWFRYQTDKKARGFDECDVVVRQTAYRRIVEHLSADTSREYGGLLLGFEAPLSHTGKIAVWVISALPAQYTEGTRSRLTFTQETWAEFDNQTEQLRKLGIALKRIGWYHSHPGHGIFLSPYDLNVCADFCRPTHVALVVDPIRNEGGFFVRGSEGYAPDDPQGFWELCDVQIQSLVIWRNLTRVLINEIAVAMTHPERGEVEALSEAATSVPASALRADADEPEVKKTSNEDGQPAGEEPGIDKERSGENAAGSSSEGQLQSRKSSLLSRFGKSFKGLVPKRTKKAS
jgi:proteasome lid subunit RPN8/RPN11